jgi:hypothetical protein
MVVDDPLRRHRHHFGHHRTAGDRHGFALQRRRAPGLCGRRRPATPPGILAARHAPYDGGIDGDHHRRLADPGRGEFGSDALDNPDSLIANRSQLSKPLQQ